jgi:hypothetical protein
MIFDEVQERAQLPLCYMQGLSVSMKVALLYLIIEWSL